MPPRPTAATPLRIALCVTPAADIAASVMNAIVWTNVYRSVASGTAHRAADVHRSQCLGDAAAGLKPVSALAATRSLQLAQEGRPQPRDNHPLRSLAHTTRVRIAHERLFQGRSTLGLGNSVALFKRVQKKFPGTNLFHVPPRTRFKGFDPLGNQIWFGVIASLMIAT